MPAPENPLIAFASAEDWEQWLETNAARSEGVWIKFAKKGSGIPSVTYAEALDVALCHGWIDGQLKSIDAAFFKQRFTPRRPRSLWSKRNIEKVAALIAAGRMKPAGQEQINAAKNDGRWAAAYDSPSTMQVPADFQAALDANPEARAFFASLKRSNVYAFLYRLQTLKRPETRAARIKDYIQLLKAGKTLHLFAPKEKPGAKG
ncbi:MAG: YdeI/OmpD-associated family protein [Nibricoccus sp.]